MSAAGTPQESADEAGDRENRRPGATTQMVLSAFGLMIIAWIYVLPLMQQRRAAAQETEQQRSSMTEAEQSGDAEGTGTAHNGELVTAQELFEAYDANEAAAQRRYGDRTLTVSGIVDSIDLDLWDRPIIRLATSNQFSPVHIHDLDNDTAASLVKGLAIRVTCDEIGEVVGSPTLKGCTLVGP